MIGFTGIRTYENKDWLMQLPFILVNAGQHTLWLHQHEQLWLMILSLYCALDA
jgi:hypothetical protein